MAKTASHANDPEYLTPETVRDMFLTNEEIGIEDVALSIALEQKFFATCDAFFELRQRFTASKAARGETVENASYGIKWQRDRKFLVSLVRLEHARKVLKSCLVELSQADKAVRSAPLRIHDCEDNGFALHPDQEIMIGSNLRCSHEIYEAGASLYDDTELFLAEVKPTALKNGKEGIDHLRQVPPGFNRNWVLKFSSLETGLVSYTIGWDVSSTPPQGPRLSNWELDRAISLVGQREFAQGIGWVAVYDPDRDHMGPKHLFQNGVRLQQENQPPGQPVN
jgi:hypothetical protein